MTNSPKGDPDSQARSRPDALLCRNASENYRRILIAPLKLHRRRHGDLLVQGDRKSCDTTFVPPPAVAKCLNMKDIQSNKGVQPPPNFCSLLRVKCLA